MSLAAPSRTTGIEPLVSPGSPPIYDLGGVPVELRSGDERWVGWVERRFGAFRQAAPPSFSIRQETTGVLPSGLASPLAVHLEAARVERGARGFRMRTASSFCEVDLVSREARLACPPALYALDNLLRHLLPLLVQPGLVLHAAALAENGRGWIAAGPSGAGKSTLAALLGARAFCDELAALRPDGREFRILSLPYWRSRPGVAQLAGIYLLRHGAHHERRRLSPREAFQSLARQVLWPAHDPEGMQSCFEILCRVIERSPIWDLAFAPHRAVWDLIRRED